VNKSLNKKQNQF